MIEEIHFFTRSELVKAFRNWLEADKADPEAFEDPYGEDVPDRQADYLIEQLELVQAK
ncbi:hypothetical protein [Hoeflea sp. TYP-13]|uniref:hypothetical protein n=1 Tax=Hoeflea sp. TYP-13 TaxID=3230023 RepID=UPI0034C63059